MGTSFGCVGIDIECKIISTFLDMGGGGGVGGAGVRMLTKESESRILNKICSCTSLAANRSKVYQNKTW